MEAVSQNEERNYVSVFKNKVNFIGKGIRHDIRRRIPYYIDDWKQSFHLKVLSSTIFMFFTSLAPAITFAVYFQDNTENLVGVTEVLLSTAVSGVIFSIFGGQPLIILGVTGPVSIFGVTLFQISKSLDLGFLPLLAWSNFWGGIITILLAITNASSLVRYVTRFSCEIFGVLIAVIYITNAIQDFINFFENETLEAALLSFILAIGTFFVNWKLDGARYWNLFTSSIRTLITDYASAISIILFTGLSFLNKLSDANPPRLSVPDHFTTTPSIHYAEDPRGNTNWLVPFWDIPIWGIFFAILPGLLLAILVFFDQNVTSLLTQQPSFNLKKGPAFHWDLFVVGIILLVLGVLGVPPTNALIPQSPLHAQSLATITEHTEEVREFVKVKSSKDKKKGKKSRWKRRKKGEEEDENNTRSIKVNNGRKEGENEIVLQSVNIDNDSHSNDEHSNENDIHLSNCVDNEEKSNDEEEEYEEEIPNILGANEKTIVELREESYVDNNDTDEQVSAKQPVDHREIVVLLKKEVWENVVENRMSPLMQSILIGVFLAPGLLDAIGWIPRGILSGLFLFMGFASFKNDQFSERLLLLITDPQKRNSLINPSYRNVPFFKIVVFTAIQFILWAIIFGITVSHTPIALGFPLFIIFIIPLRYFLFPKISFLKDHLQFLDDNSVA